MFKVIAMALAIAATTTVAGAQATSTYNKSTAKPATQANATPKRHKTMKKSESQATLRKEAKISEETARATALKEVPNGKVKSSELERENGKLIYSYDITVPEVGSFSHLETLTGGSYGKKLKEDARRHFGSFVYFAGRGEMIPNEHSYCEIDPNKKDAWGIPVLRFHFKWSEHEEKQAAHMQKTFADIIEAMGGRVWYEPGESAGARFIVTLPVPRRRQEGMVELS